jgi:hypothetical protein
MSYGLIEYSMMQADSAPCGQWLTLVSRPDISEPSFAVSGATLVGWVGETGRPGDRLSVFDRLPRAGGVWKGFSMPTGAYDEAGMQSWFEEVASAGAYAGTKGEWQVPSETWRVAAQEGPGSAFLYTCNFAYLQYFWSSYCDARAKDCAVVIEGVKELTEAGMYEGVCQAVSLARKFYGKVSSIRVQIARDPEIAERKTVRFLLGVAGNHDEILECERLYKRAVRAYVDALLREVLTITYEWEP